MPDSTVKTNAVISRSYKSGENDRMLTLLSPEMGKLSVIAKGVRSLRHKSGGAVQPLCYCSFVLKRLRDGFFSLVSAECIESFPALSESVESLSYGVYFAALCEMCFPPSGAEKEVSLLLNSLYVLTKRSDAAPLVKAVFELKLAELYGIMPDFTPDCPCGAPATHFSFEDGETRCALHSGRGIKISPRALSLACYISENSLRDAFFCNGDSASAEELGKVNEEFLAYHLGNLPKSLQYLHKL